MRGRSSVAVQAIPQYWGRLGGQHPQPRISFHREVPISKPTGRDTGFLDRAILAASGQALDDLDQAEAELRKHDQSRSLLRIWSLHQSLQEQSGDDLVHTLRALREELIRLDGILTGEYRAAAKRMLRFDHSYEHRDLIALLK